MKCSPPTFWLYWRTMFAFENWHSALEMKLYYPALHPPHRRACLTSRALKFTKYNQYESLILPMQKYLESHGVDFQFGTEVTNVIFDIRGRARRSATADRVPGERRGAGASTSPRTTWCSSPTAAAPRAPSTATRTTPPTGTPRCAPAAAGACGRTSPPRTPPLAVRRSSAATSPRPTGSRPPSPLWTMRRSSRYIDEDLQAGSPLRQGGHRRHRQLSRTPSWLLSWTINRQGQFKEQEPKKVCASGCTASVHRRARRLCEKAHEGVHRQGDHSGVALPSSACRWSRSTDLAAPQRCNAIPDHDALYHRLLHAPHARATVPT